MSVEYRNQAIARVAFAVANSDGDIAPSEREALLEFMLRYPDIFDEYDRNDILAYFDNFLLHLDNYRRKTPVMDDWRIQNLTNYVFVEDLSAISGMLDALAEADGNVLDEEASIVSRIRIFVQSRLKNAPQAHEDDGENITG
jgi:uncharacterized tellurite resistance protein B-like protein